VLRIIFTVFIVSLIGSFQANAFFFEQEDDSETPTSDAPKTTTFQRSTLSFTHPINSFKQHTTDLNHYLPEDAITQVLTVGENQYTIVEETSATQNDKGIAIILPDWQQGLINPKSINYLKTTLPHHGWATLSIQAPNKPNNYPAVALTQKEITEKNATALSSYKDELKALMTAVMEKAKNYPGIFLVISEGSQAAMLTDIYKNTPDLLPTAMVMLSAGMYSAPENENFAKNVATSELPILDLLLKRDNQTVLHNARLRKKHTTKAMKIYYRQKYINNITTSYYPEKALLTEIKGWLKTNGW